MMDFKYIITAVTILMAILCARGEDNPVADDRAVVTCGNARFTVLTPQMIRMEWSETGNWENRKSLTFVNRHLKVPGFTSRVSQKGATITTSAGVKLSYKNDGKPFNANNLSVNFKMNGKKIIWTPGMKDTLNLMGTTRTLDRTDGYKLGREPMETGLLSRGGWTLVDDSTTPLFIPTVSHWNEWVTARDSVDHIDWYILAYGHDYKKALGDYQKVAGAATLPPKSTFGYWWSRYWQYSDDELVDVVNKLKSHDIPLDVLVVDMDWHDTFGLTRNNPRKDEYGQRIGWTGYTWQKQLFPSPSNFLKWARNNNLLTALNLHPASGIQPYEDCYDAFTLDYGWDKKGESIPFRIDEEKWADSYFKTVLSPMEEMGVDFWWLDWQQWLNSKYTKGLSNTFWLNHTFYNHFKGLKDNAGKRPFIYHRWGGLGSHRYPLGFSGDTYATWETLSFLPWFTSTASNVNYGYWGHDIGGHLFHSNVKDTDPELYLRWLQYGVFTPIFKTHSTKDHRIVRYPWAFPSHQFMLRDAMHLRYALVPYIYNAARENYDTGIAMCRPMYYEYPEVDMAYDTPEQYFFGNDIIATAISVPVDSVTGLAPRKIWLPEGKWYDYSTGELLEGNREYARKYTLNENPFFIKAGAIIPMNPKCVKSLAIPCDTLVLTFIPGGNGSLIHYEDDGISEEYKTAYAKTRISKTTDNNIMTIKISRQEGTYSNAPEQRAYELRFPATMPPKSVTVNGIEYTYSRFPHKRNWGYDGISLQPIVYTEMLPVNKDMTIILNFEDNDFNPRRLYGKQRIFRRCRSLTPEFKKEQCLHGESYVMLPKGYLKVAQCPNFIVEDPFNINRHLEEFDNAFENLSEIIEKHKYSGDRFKKRLLSQLEP